MKYDEESLREVDEIAPAMPLARGDARYMPADLLAKRQVEVNAMRDELRLIRDAKFWASDSMFVAWLFRWVFTFATFAAAMAPIWGRNVTLLECLVMTGTSFVLMLVSSRWMSAREKALHAHQEREKELTASIERLTSGGGVR